MHLPALIFVIPNVVLKAARLELQERLESTTSAATPPQASRHNHPFLAMLSQITPLSPRKADDITKPYLDSAKRRMADDEDNVADIVYACFMPTDFY